MIDISVPQGAALARLSSGGIYVRTHYTVDKNKRNPEWIAAGRAAMGPREWDREMEMREDIWDGLPVFPEYIDDRHCPLEYRKKKIPVVTDRAFYVGGWDAGMTLRPAFSLWQVVYGETRLQYQIQGVLEVTTEFALPMETFAPKVNDALHTHCPEIVQRITHVGDETIRQRSGSRGETAQMVAQEHGIFIFPMTNKWEPRKSAMQWAVNGMIDETTPRMVICGKTMPMLRKGFQGAYCLDYKAGQVGAGGELKMPLKNVFSHVADSAQYAMLEIKRELEAGNSGGVTQLGMSL